MLQFLQQQFENITCHLGHGHSMSQVTMLQNASPSLLPSANVLQYSILGHDGFRRHVG